MIKNMWREDSGDYQASPWYQQNWSGGAPRRTAPVMGGNDAWGQPNDRAYGQAELPGMGSMAPGAGGYGTWQTPRSAPNDMVGGARPNPRYIDPNNIMGEGINPATGMPYMAGGGDPGMGKQPNPWQGKLPGSAAASSDMVPGASPNPNMGTNPPKMGDPAPNVLSPEMEELRRRREMTAGFQQFRNVDNDYRRNQTQYLQKPFQQLTLEEMQQRPMHGGWQAQGGPATSRGSPFKANYENYRTY